MQQQITRWLEQFGLEFGGVMSLLMVLGLIVLISVAIHGAAPGGAGRPSAPWPAIAARLATGHHPIQTVPARGAAAAGVIISIRRRCGCRAAAKPVAIVTAAQVWILAFTLLSLFSLLDTLLALLRQSPISISCRCAAFSRPETGGGDPDRHHDRFVADGQIAAAAAQRHGAMTAVLMLVFKDPILGLVAGIQLSANDMLKIGDWLEMPKYGADGAVTDIGLTTVKVRNWDNTITTIPTYALISDSFKNWRSMSESGGRRIKRSLNIDTGSVHFLSEEEQRRLQRNPLLHSYLNVKTQELSQHNREIAVDLASPLNGRRLTNLGTLRAYLEAYLRAHPRIHQNMTLMVRQLAPTPEGLPLEIYAFTNTTVWAEYESIQADIFDHILAVIDEFGLRVHQTPTGNDLRGMLLQNANAS